MILKKKKKSWSEKNKTAHFTAIALIIIHKSQPPVCSQLDKEKKAKSLEHEHINLGIYKWCRDVIGAVTTVSLNLNNLSFISIIILCYFLRNLFHNATDDVLNLFYYYLLLLLLV